MEAFCSLQFRPKPPCVPASPWKKDGLSFPGMWKSQRPLAPAFLTSEQDWRVNQPDGGGEGRERGGNSHLKAWKRKEGLCLGTGLKGQEREQHPKCPLRRLPIGWLSQ